MIADVRIKYNNTVSDNRKVILGLSGGVDSTAAALLLLEQGYEVIGLYFDVFRENRKGIEKAEKTADELGIKLIRKNVCKKFNDLVVKNFINEYLCGRTPNPCVLCNPEIKFRTLIETANEEGAACIATGHYANIKYSSRQECYAICQATNIKKDQSYMLYRLPKEYISRLILPLGEIDSKEKTRELVRNCYISNSEDKDSQEICFLEDGISYKQFLERNGAIAPKGNFVDKYGTVLGQHKGITYYTIGQRKGLGIALGRQVFVTGINSDNTVVLGENEDLFSNNVYCKNIMFTSTGSSQIPKFVENNRIYGKIRYAAEATECSIEKSGEGIIVKFIKPQRAATPGQSLVLYVDGEVIGGGIISSEK